ncbi:uncharacterized protein LOC144560818 [Carex rostrata]
MKVSITTARLLPHQGLPFRGHDESENSHNKGNFFEFLNVYSKANEDKNKEQMAVLLCYVDKRGHVLEQFIRIVHVTDTTALSLKEAISAFLFSLNLSLSRVREQGYDGVSNMRGSFNGLKSLILRENSSAHYIHCFAHQLQLALVYVARHNDDADWFFVLLSQSCNIVGGSAKRRDLFREKQTIKVIEELSHGNLETGKGLNQELGLRRSGDTRWGSHYGSVLNLLATFSCVIEVLQIVGKDSPKQDQKTEANRLVKFLQDFDFVFLLHLMKNVLGITNELCLALQRKDQDIENEMALVKVAKDRLQAMRDDGWTCLLDEVSSFCTKHEINIPNMENRFVLQGKSARKAPHITHLHHYRVDIFCAIIDTQLQELNNRFDEINSELLLCMACLNSRDSFRAFDREKLVKLASFYPAEFSDVGLVALSNQLENFIVDVRTMDRFSNLNRLSELASVMVKTNKHITHP